MLGDQLRRPPPARRERPIVIGELAILPARLRMPEQQQMLHGPRSGLQRVPARPGRGAGATSTVISRPSAFAVLEYELAATLAERGALTTRDVRELTSARAQHAAAQLPTGPFAPLEPAWPATVGGHITATPDDAPEPLRAALEAAQAALPR